MTTPRTYSKRTGAKKAALADLGQRAVEGVDFEIIKLDDGRFTYGPTKGLSGLKRDKGSVEAEPRAKSAMSGRDKGDNRDEFGLRKGSKRSKAAAMFAKGATMKAVKDKLGQSHYNLLKKLKADGHTIKETENGTITATPN